jgi:predicted metalloprotease with PDZ domain
LDPVMRYLWQHCKAGPMNEDDVLNALKALTGRSWRREIKAWVHGTVELPLQQLLQAQGVEIIEENCPLAHQLGLRVQENHSIHIQTVLNGSAAEIAGFAPGDEWLGVAITANRRTDASAWRIKRLDQLPHLIGKHKNFTALISRDGRLLQLPLRMPSKPVTQWRLGIAQAHKVGLWLAGKQA